MKRALFYFLLCSPILGLFLSLFIGPAPLSVPVVFKTILLPLNKVLPAKCQISCPSSSVLILFDIRLPRILLAMGVGAALAVSGAILQALFQNPLVDSYILGISAGGAFGTALALALSLPFGITPLSFVFSLLAVGLTYSLARMGEVITPISLVLGGIIINAFFSALTSLLKLFMSHERLAEIIYWLMGSFGNTDWKAVKLALPIIFVCLVLTFLLRWKLNVLSLGEEAKLVGLETERMQLFFILLVSLMTGISVAFCGVIGWIGLIVPHLIRMAFGPDHKRLIPLAATTGATFLLLADDLARGVMTYEMPIGLLTTLLGIPFFAYLLKKTGGGWYA